jgi:hypothetical protein
MRNYRIFDSDRIFADVSMCHYDHVFSLLLPVAGGTGSLTYVTDTPVQCRLSQGLGSLTTVTISLKSNREVFYYCEM